MNEEDFHTRWSDRVARYPGSSLSQDDGPIHIHIDPRYAKTYAGQVATITAASLFSRMCRRVAVDVPSPTRPQSLAVGRHEPRRPGRAHG